MTHVPFLLEIFSYSVFAFFFALFFTPSFLAFLRKYRIRKAIREDAMDGAGAKIFRSLHLKKEGTPTMGGILIWVTVLFVILFSRVLSFIGVFDQSLLQRGEVYLPLFTLIAMGILGGIDDYFNIRGIGKKKGIEALPKLLFTLLFALAAALWFAFKLKYSSIHIPGVGDFEIGLWYIPLFILVFVATANAVNVTDGLDGLAGGLLIIAYGVFVVIAYAKGLNFLATFCAVIIGALLAFLWHNIPPAKYFMGDTGSLALGATLGVIALMIDAIFILPIAGFIFVIETCSVLLQLWSKKFRGKKIFLIAPLHHHYEKKGWTESQIVMRFWIIGGMFAVVALIIGLIGMGIRPSTEFGVLPQEPDSEVTESIDDSLSEDIESIRSTLEE